MRLMTMIVVALCGCGWSAEEVREHVTLTASATVAPGDSLELTLRNGLLASVEHGYSLCAVTYSPALPAPETPSACPAAAAILPTGYRFTAFHTIPPETPPGIYTVTTTVAVNELLVTLDPVSFEVIDAVR